MVNDVKGQNVYKEHLPLLGELGPGRTGPHGLQVGDQVSLNFARKPITNLQVFISGIARQKVRMLKEHPLSHCPCTALAITEKRA